MNVYTITYAPMSLEDPESGTPDEIVAVANSLEIALAHIATEFPQYHVVKVDNHADTRYHVLAVIVDEDDEVADIDISDPSTYFVIDCVELLIQPEAKK